jgi:hypothetical protein
MDNLQALKNVMKREASIESVFSKWKLRKGNAANAEKIKQWLDGFKGKFRKRTDGTLEGALQAAAASAVKNQITYAVWKGNSFMHAVWNVSDPKKQSAPASFERIADQVYIITPDLEVVSAEFQN